MASKMPNILLQDPILPWFTPNLQGQALSIYSSTMILARCSLTPTSSLNQKHELYNDLSIQIKLDMEFTCPDSFHYFLSHLLVKSLS